MKEQKKMLKNKWYQKHRDELLEGMKKYQEDNKEKLQAYRKEYYKKYIQNEDQKKRAVEYAKIYYQKNKEKIRQRYLDKKNDEQKS